jgi:hypothetical protein
MIWLGWRQQRTETLIAAAMLAMLAALLIPTGLTIASAYHDGGLAACAGPGVRGCDDAIAAFIQRFSAIGGLIDWVTLLPGVVGVLIAASFVSSFENGTYRLDWTQSVTRGRWVAGKLGLAVGSALLIAIALTVLITWWRAPFVHLQGRVNNGSFDSEGTVVAAYTLFALGLALAIGALWRRAVPSLVVGFAGYFAVRLFVDTWLRQRLVDPVSTTWKMPSRGPDLSKAWVIDQYPTDAQGHPIRQICKPTGGGTACRVDAGNTDAPGFMHAVYHPNSHFWALQGIETALFGVAAVALIAFAVWWTLRRARS